MMDPSQGDLLRRPGGTFWEVEIKGDACVVWEHLFLFQVQWLPWDCLCWKVVCLMLLLSHFSCVRLCVPPQTAAHWAPPSLGFSRQEYWSGLPLPSPVSPMAPGQLHYYIYPTRARGQKRVLSTVLQEGHIWTSFPVSRAWRAPWPWGPLPTTAAGLALSC